MTPENFKKGMTRLTTMFGVTLTAELADVYHEALSDLTDEQWALAVRQAVRTSEFMPRPAVLLKAAAVDVKLLANAVRVFDSVLESGEYNPHGTVWSYRAIRNSIGPAAAEAFSAAGGPSEFRRLAEGDSRIADRDLPFTRNRFTDAYIAAVRADSRLALPAGTSLKELAPAKLEFAKLEFATPEEAKGWVAKIKASVGGASGV